MEHLVTLIHVHTFAFLAWVPVPAVRLVTGFDIGGLVTMTIVWYLVVELVGSAGWRCCDADAKVAQ